MKRCLVVKEIQIRTTVGCYFTPNKMAIIKRWTITKARVCGDWSSPTLLWECKNGATSVKNSMAIPQVVKREPYDPVIALLGL